MPKKATNVMIGESAHQRYTRAAKDEGLSLSQFLRTLILLGWEVYKDDKATLKGELK